MTTELIERAKDEEQAIALIDHAKAMIIVTIADRAEAETFVQELSVAEKKRFAYLDPERKTAYENYLHHKQRLDDAIEPLISARKTVKQKCITYDTEQERLRLEEQRKLEVEARKRAEEEALALAAQLEAEGDKEAAEAIIEAPLYVAPVFVQKPAQKPSRLTAGRSVWSAEVVSLILLVKAVVEGKQPMNLLLPNQVALNQMATALKENFNVPGVRAKEEKV